MSEIDADTEAAKIREEARKFEVERWLSSWQIYSGQVHEQRMAATKSINDYGTLAIRSLFILNGGAILALLTFLGSLFARTDKTMILVAVSMAHQLTKAFYLYTFGITIAALIAGIAYINWSAMEQHYQTPSQLYNIMVGRDAPETLGVYVKLANITAIICIILGFIGLGLFIAGSFQVAEAFHVIGA